MALSSGTRLGLYEITGTLGVGGMGEVYRATDTNLKREVAIKTLPVELAQDPERLARFEREAQLVAALNHAHIAAVYGLDRHDGTLYLAMELVGGETFEEKLKAGALPVDDTLRLGLQIAEALEAAHDKGVVHRDLKPANIMITPDGVVKVLDFGLAKAFAGDPAEASPAHSPALSMAMTQQGLILGTAGYMSPEQASGQATDQRADVWAFGVVLFEMLSGLPLFSGESVPHVLAAVLQTEPDWSRLPKNLHPRLKFLLERCLEKKARNRYHGIADARVDIERILSDPHGAALSSTETVAPAQPLWRRALPVAAALVVGGLVAGSAAWVLQPEPDAPIVSRLVMPQSAEYPFSLNGFNYDLALSPDGTRIAYRAVADGQPALVLRELDSFETTLLHSGNVVNLFFSPDGSWIGFFDLNSRAFGRIPVTGGSPIEIGSPGPFPRGAVWGIDDEIIYATGNASGLWRVPAGGGTPEALTELDASRGEVAHQWPQLLPGGDAILFTAYLEAETSSSTEIRLRELATGEERVLLEGGSDGRILPTGHLVYGYQGTLRAVPFDLERREIVGNPVAILDDIVTTNVESITGAISQNGTLVYVRGSGAGREVVLVDADGNEEPVGIELRNVPIMSPDGSRIAWDTATGADTESNIWILSLASGAPQQLTFDSDRQIDPLWTPDGGRIVYQSQGDGLFSRAANGTGNLEALIETPDRIMPFSWTADGELVYQTRPDNDGDWDIGVLSSGSRPRLILASDADERNPAVSPDGNWVAYELEETPVRSEVLVRPFPDVEGAGPYRISLDGGSEPFWSADGSRIFFLGPASIMAVQVSTERNFTPGPPVPVLDRGNYRFTNRGRNYGVTPDDRFIVITRGSVGSEIVVVQNWFEELKRLVPID
jgi:Tol biopolymer transport system component